MTVERSFKVAETNSYLPSRLPNEGELGDGVQSSAPENTPKPSDPSITVQTPAVEHDEHDIQDPRYDDLGEIGRAEDHIGENILHEPNIAQPPRRV